MVFDKIIYPAVTVAVNSYKAFLPFFPNIFYSIFLIRKRGLYMADAGMKKMVVIGMGYVGIPAAALFADTGKYEVVGIQRRSERSGWKIDHLNCGLNPIGGDEPGLGELIHRVILEKKTFRVSDDYSEIKDADFVLIDVQTPTDEDHAPRYLSLKEVSATTGRYLRDSSKKPLVVIESTVAPGTTTNIVLPILEHESGKTVDEGFYLAFAYERVMVGRLIHNIVNLARIVGGATDKSTKKGMELYADIVKAPRHATDSLTAEITKVVENTYRDVNIAFANEVALICESLGVDAFKVRELVNTLPYDPSNPAANPVRNLHIPGAGVGGHCLPKDPWLLIWGMNNYGKFSFTPEVIVNSRKINTFMPVHMVELVEKGLERAGISAGRAKIAVLGYAFLENSDDTRNTPAKDIIDILLSKGMDVRLHDPHVRDEEPTPVEIERDLYAVLEGAHAVVIVTKHNEYEHLYLEKVRDVMAGKVFVDGRNLYEKGDMEKKGFVYLAVGKDNR